MRRKTHKTIESERFQLFAILAWQHTILKRDVSLGKRFHIECFCRIVSQLLSNFNFPLFGLLSCTCAQRKSKFTVSFGLLQVGFCKFFSILLQCFQVLVFKFFKPEHFFVFNSLPSFTKRLHAATFLFLFHINLQTKSYLLSNFRTSFIALLYTFSLRYSFIQRIERFRVFFPCNSRIYLQYRIFEYIVLSFFQITFSQKLQPKLCCRDNCCNFFKYDISNTIWCGSGGGWRLRLGSSVCWYVVRQIRENRILRR